MLQGRDFTGADSASSMKVAIVNQTFVDRYLPGRQPLGHHVAIDGKHGEQYTIIGVAQNSKYTSAREREVRHGVLPLRKTDIAAGKWSCAQKAIRGFPAVSTSA